MILLTGSFHNKYFGRNPSFLWHSTIVTGLICDGNIEHLFLPEGLLLLRAHYPLGQVGCREHCIVRAIHARAGSSYWKRRSKGKAQKVKETLRWLNQFNRTSQLAFIYVNVSLGRAEMLMPGQNLHQSCVDTFVCQFGHELSPTHNSRNK